MSLRLIIVPCFVLLVTALPAQVQMKSSRMEHVQVETNQMYEAINKANALVDSKPKEALDEVETALRLSYKTGSKRGEAYSYQTLGNIHFELGNYDKAIDYDKKALDEFKKLGDSKGEYLVYKHLASAQEAKGLNADAISNFSTFLNLAIARNNTADQVLAKEALGRLLFNTKAYKEANVYYLQLLSGYRAGGQTDQVTATYEHIGKCYAGLKDTAQALRYFNLAGTVADVQSNTDQQLNTWQNVSRSYNSVGEYDKSVEYEKKAKKINTERGKKSEVIQNNKNIATDYLFMDRANEAIPLLVENLNLSEELGEVKSTGETYKVLSQAYQKVGNMEDARNSFEKYVELQEELLQQREEELSNREANTSGLFDKEKQIELLVKDKELDEEKIRLLEQEKALEVSARKGQRRVLYILLGVLVLVVVGLVLLYRSVKQKQLANKLLSIRSLRSQMNPHFIFNSLNSVNSFISKSDERSANKYLTEFARLMRTVLEHSKHDFVTLSDELSVLERYLNLEHIRFNQHFDFELVVDEELQKERLLIPPMLVQPYVENAIWHGLRYLDHKGWLSVKFESQDEEMVIVIRDNGIGRTRSAELKTRNQKEGKSTGIRNTASRLELLNDVHHLNLRADIRDAEEDGSGTIVTLHLPYIDVDDKRYAEA